MKPAIHPLGTRGPDEMDGGLTADCVLVGGEAPIHFDPARTSELLAPDQGRAAAEDSSGNPPMPGRGQQARA